MSLEARPAIRDTVPQPHLIHHPMWHEVLLEPTSIRTFESASDDAPERSGMKIVLNEHFADPSVFRSPVGPPYCAVATNHMYPDGRLVKVLAATSYDMKEWELQYEDALEELAEWSRPQALRNYYDNGDIAVVWAPFVDVDYKAGLFKKYYATPLKKVDKYYWWATSVAVSEHPTKGYKDKSKEPLAVSFGYGCIDPFVRRNQEGEVELFTGSDGEPIQKILLSDDGLSRKNHTTRPEVYIEPIPFDFYLREPEGVYIDVYNNEDIAFVSGSDCYGKGFQSNGAYNNEFFGEYAIVAIRRDGETGELHSKIVLEGNKDILNPGNNSIIRDNEQSDEITIFGHLIDRNDRYLPGKRLNKRKMFMAKARYTDEGWPVVIPSA